ncbi:hypothetical protein SCLCIDRAFT_1213569 [Scleroderma citrinum Foug A]|uniref:Uncharacterized protein n=1 Tax=Scleroderma citrinum Foug A TaxID=1036808 RepID=A0A0C3E6V4_9AGAM|nr:hypothetical protein SCLCIDRAFT_1213569 [Scleroderma citrinum Foug A]
MNLEQSSETLMRGYLPKKFGGTADGSSNRAPGSKGGASWGMKGMDCIHNITNGRKTRGY